LAQELRPRPAGLQRALQASQQQEAPRPALPVLRQRERAAWFPLVQAAQWPLALALP
jgi:hypothetical protein